MTPNRLSFTETAPGIRINQTNAAGGRLAATKAPVVLADGGQGEADLPRTRTTAVKR
ncbi:hypothetical protein [Amycolatopsis circi]|uniref:hypothetical protein n=1 Tax=Amycolatopsis circi TaxID=871959 RepID=UPI0013BE9CE2|nr:hypothetical protein [Amycolatopsis circi]